VVVFIVQHFWKKFADFFEAEEPQTYLFPALIFIFAIMFISPTYKELGAFLKRGQAENFPIAQANWKPGQTYDTIGGKPVADFVRENIPQKSVFMTPGSSSYTFPIFLDQFIPDYPRTKGLTRANLIYSEKATDQEKLQIIIDSKIEYVLLTKTRSQGVAFFTGHPEAFQNIFAYNEAVIYKVVKN